MTYRKLSITVATLAVLVPALSQAGPEKNALKACARAFASSLASPGAAAPAFKVDFRGSQFTESMLEVYTFAYTFDLRANDSKTGAAIARASCSTDARGAVLTLSPAPLDAEQPTLAARF